MEHVCIGHSIDCGVDGNAEKEDTGEVTETRCDSWHHLTTGQSFDQKDKRHDRKDVVVRGEGCKPVNGQVVHPNHEDRKVYWEDPKHEDEDRMDIVVEVVICVRGGFSGESKGSCTSGDLDKTCHKIGELVRYNG